MKTKTIGNYFYLVAVYYTDKDDCMQCYHERWSSKEYAHNSRETYKEMVGKWFDGIEIQGKICDVFTYKCRQCVFE